MTDLLTDAPRELLEVLLASVADAVYLVDHEGRVQFCNPEGLRVLGYDEHPDELIGHVSHPTIHYRRPDGSPFPDAECPMLRPRITGETVRVDEDWFVRRDGTMVPVAYSSAPLAMAGGRGAVVAFRDISERLAAERTRELEASRARIVAAADAERRRIGRDLHDGAQQRLVALLMTLQRADPDDPTGVQETLDAAAGELRAAVAELRDLATGIHPAVLTNLGLRAAVEGLTARAPVPVLVDVPRRRWPGDVESTAYFVVAEALTNVAKHAPTASHVEVRVSEAPGGRLTLSVRDDGPGGARPRGIEDRVAAVGGTLRVDSPPGGGTTLRVTL